LVWCLVSKDREFLVNSWDWAGRARAVAKGATAKSPKAKSLEMVEECIFKDCGK
jgi:hypothetical protein